MLKEKVKAKMKTTLRCLAHAPLDMCLGGRSEETRLCFRVCVCVFVCVFVCVLAYPSGSRIFKKTNDPGTQTGATHTIF